VRIAYVITRADAVGGASVHVRDLARGVLERGHQAVVLVGGRGPVTEQLACAGVPFHSLRFLRRPIHPVRDLRALFELSAAIRDWRPDLVSTHTAKAGWVGRAACARLGFPVVYTPHGWSIADRISPVHGGIFCFAERAASRWAAAIICVCEYERQLALRKRVAHPQRLQVVHNGVGDVPAGLRAKPGLRPVRLISVARFEPPKDQPLLLKALAGLRSLEWQLDLVGDGPAQSRVRRLAGALGIAGRVRFLGYQPEPERALAGAQVFVLSSRSEGLPRSVLEALRAGLPVVASDVGGVGEAVVHGANGLLVPRDSPDALAAALAGLIADGSRRQRLGRAARLTYEARFQLQGMIEKTAALYEAVLKHNSGPQGTR